MVWVVQEETKTGVELALIEFTDEAKANSAYDYIKDRHRNSIVSIYKRIGKRRKIA